jgi:hypothetical protein
MLKAVIVVHLASLAYLEHKAEQISKIIVSKVHT